MLRWRLPLGILLVAALLGLCWLDEWLKRVTGVPGMVLFPVLAVFVVLATQEVLQLAAAGGVRPVPWAVYGGNLLVVTTSWIAPVCHKLAGNLPQELPAPRGDWTLLAVVAAVALAFVAEMRGYQKPGGVAVSVAVAVLGVAYVGLLLSFLIQLRYWWGLRALLSLLIVVKMADTGAYAVGRIVGRHKMAPSLSPKKTVEGAIGALVVACLSSWATFGWLLPSPTSAAVAGDPWWGWLLFGLLIGVAGMVGDLAESLLKREAGRKESSDWMPGFGGVLDLLDSVLLAAPVAYVCWTLGLVA
jgi:phosphatidate cytidylyltransferase